MYTLYINAAQLLAVVSISLLDLGILFCMSSGKIRIRWKEDPGIGRMLQGASMPIYVRDRHVNLFVSRSTVAYRPSKSERMSTNRYPNDTLLTRALPRSYADCFAPSWLVRNLVISFVDYSNTSLGSRAP